MRFETQTNLYDNQPLITKLTSHDTRFDVVQGEINALISESELTELIDGGSTIYSAMNDIKVDVSGLHADLSEMNTTIDGQSGQITQLSSKQAEYEASLESLSATLSDTNATLYGDGETAGITTRMTNIEATASGISSSVSSLSSNLQNNYYNKGAVDNIASGISSSASSALTSAVSGLQNQIDGKIETWCGSVVPTTSNYPASSWNTSVLKDQHIGDLYYDTKAGYAYQYAKSGNTYQWNVVTASGIGEAITLAGNKKRIFVAQPTPPYEIGDLWVQGSNGDILRCGTARASGNYVTSDWIKASKYTDDTTANQVATNLANNYSTTTQIQQNSNGIITTAISNVDGANFISQINQTAESISIDADKINLNGFISANETFTIDEDGFFSAEGGTIGGWTITDKKMYAGDSTTGVAVMQKPTDNTTWVFAAGGTSHSSYSDCPFRVKKNGEVYATTVHLSGIMDSDLIVSEDPANFRLRIGSLGISTVNLSNNQNRGLSLRSRGLYLYSYDGDDKYVGSLLSHYNSSNSVKTLALTVPDMADGKTRLAIGTMTFIGNEFGAIDPYITLNDSRNNLITFKHNIATNLRIQESGAVNHNLFMSYQRLSFNKIYSGNSVSYMSFWNDMSKQTEINNPTARFGNGDPGLFIKTGGAPGNAIIITANGIFKYRWYTAYNNYIYDSTIMNF